MMAVDASLDARIRQWEEQLGRSVDGQQPLTLTPAWWQERLLDWATNDPDFRVKLLRFVDVLPALRSAGSIADHVRQYFRGSAPGVIQTASGLAAQPVFRPVLSRVVRQGVFSMAHRFIAGETPAAAVPALRELAEDGVASTVDLLGEETLSDAEADAYLARYMDLLETLTARRGEIAPRGERWAGVPPVNISVKLSALCAHLEPAAPEHVSKVAGDRLRPLLRMAMQRGAYINFDMEQYRYKDLVQRTFSDLALAPGFAAFPHLGIVVQAYLRDAVEDLTRYREVAKRRGTPLTIRLVKGAYWDEERIVAAQNSWPVPVFEQKSETDASFEACTDALLRSWPHLRPAFGSHNPRSVGQAIVKARDAGLGETDVEFQTLYGMAEGLRTAVAEAGYRTRVYIPVGQVIPGMAYLVRRLLENTSNQAWFNAGASLSIAQATGTPDTHQGPSIEVLPSPSHGRGAGGEGFANAAPAAFFHEETRQRMQAALARTRKGFGESYPLLIGDSRVSKRTQADVRYPAEPDTVIGRMAQATMEDVETAVAAAREAFPSWRDRPAVERGDILRRAAELLEERRFDLAATMVFESAKPWHEADGDVCEAIDYLRYYAAQGERLSAPRLLSDVPGEENEYFHEGRGVTAVIAPWNFPLAIITGMSVAALAGGNTAILKPAAQSPIIAYKLVETLREAGVPDGVVQYLPGSGGEIGRALVEHPGVDNIAFTGSSAVGLGIIEAASRVREGQRNVKRVVAEMGGKNAIIIDDDADLDQAVHGTLISAFGYAGQKCSACSRLIIVGSAYDEALERLKNAVASLIVGPPHDRATFVPPVIGPDARDKIMGYIESGQSYATLVVQAAAPSSTFHLPSSGASYVPPTVFTDVPLDSPLAREEIFGPVLSVFRAKDFEEALEIAMNSDFALTGGVFSRNPRHIEAARRAFRAGNLYINRKITGAIAGRQPFGGLAMSGVGEKAGGPDYVRQFMQPRVVTENTMRRGFAPEDGA
jgi:RHH-type transcriptional regulator, proline utilization regulon repressor / proline dehydrogenase / delta 1-pyrroline-5-carboxylate dehydrogenase